MNKARIKPYYKALILKADWVCWETDEENTTESPETDPHTWFMTKMTLRYSGERMNFSINGAGLTGYTYFKKLILTSNHIQKSILDGLYI